MVLTENDRPDDHLARRGPEVDKTGRLGRDLPTKIQLKSIGGKHEFGVYSLSLRCLIAQAIDRATSMPGDSSTYEESWIA